VANPHIQVTYAGTTRSMTARKLQEYEKHKTWPYVISLYPDYDKYQAATERSIPVFKCRV
jgi:deazaflavin-dependent oxidoreductase (nitroreductase family)